MSINTMDIWSYLKASNKKIVLYGTGNGADKVLDRLYSDGVSVSGVFASSGFVRDRYFRGFKVKSYAETAEELTSFIVLMCFGSSREEVFENVKKISSEQEFYIADVPVVGDNIFDEKFYNLHKSEIEKVSERLCDDESRRVFQNIVSFKLSGKSEFLFAAETPENRYEDILTLKNNARILDLGAYTGDTVLKLSALNPTYSEIIAVEPNKNSFKKLKALSENMKNVIAVNAVISDKNGVSFLPVGNRGRGSREEIAGEEIPAVTVDTLLCGGSADLIKTDVEGNELKALTGAENTIKRYKPKLIVSCYHRSEDIFTLPQKVFEMRNDYKMFMRHKKSIPAWDTEFIFV